MSDAPHGYGWWQANDGLWYPPERHPDYRPPEPVAPTPNPYATPTAQTRQAGGGKPPVTFSVPPKQGMSAGKIVAIVIGVALGIGALVLIALVALGVFVSAGVDGINNDSSVSACQIEAQTVKTAVQAYQAQNREYPESSADLVSASMLTELPAGVAYELVGGTPKFTWSGRCADLDLEGP
jgi:hypothetical protein